MLIRYTREVAPAIAFALLLSIVAIASPNFFSAGNLRDLALNNAAALVVAVGMTLVILVGEIDISIGSQFAVCSVLVAVAAKEGAPVALLPAIAIGIGAAMGSVNGLLVGALGLPSIIVTLAMMVAWRDALRWATEGAWVQNLPANFQWFGLSQTIAVALIVLSALATTGICAFVLRNFAAGRSLYATGASAESARLSGINTTRVRVLVFTIMGALTGFAALSNAVRFAEVPSNAGVGLEMKAIAAVVVGGASITGGRASMTGTLIGVALLGTIGTALTFAGINPFWEKAIQGAIILAALSSEAVLARLLRNKGHVSRIADAAAVER